MARLRPNSDRKQVRPLQAGSMERMTGIEPALSAWELACHMRLDHEIADHRHLSTCLPLSALTPCLSFDRARGGHAFELPHRRSFRGRRSTAGFLVRPGFLVVWLPLDAGGSRSVLAHGWHGYACSSYWPASCLRFHFSKSLMPPKTAQRMIQYAMYAPMRRPMMEPTAVHS